MRWFARWLRRFWRRASRALGLVPQAEQLPLAARVSVTAVQAPPEVSATPDSAESQATNMRPNASPATVKDLSVIEPSPMVPRAEASDPAAVVHPIDLPLPGHQIERPGEEKADAGTPAADHAAEDVLLIASGEGKARAARSPVDNLLGSSGTCQAGVASPSLPVPDSELRSEFVTHLRPSEDVALPHVESTASASHELALPWTEPRVAADAPRLGSSPLQATTKKRAILPEKRGGRPRGPGKPTVLSAPVHKSG